MLSLLHVVQILSKSLIFPYFTTAWYDADLEQYQKERQETELESFFQERQAQKAQQGDISFEPRHKQPTKEPELEWQRAAKEKRGEDYYSKLREVGAFHILCKDI